MKKLILMAHAEAGSKGGNAGGGAGGTGKKRLRDRIGEAGGSLRRGLAGAVSAFRRGR